MTNTMDIAAAQAALDAATAAVAPTWAAVAPAWAASKAASWAAQAAAVAASAAGTVQHRYQDEHWAMAYFQGARLAMECPTRCVHCKAVRAPSTLRRHAVGTVAKTQRFPAFAEGAPTYGRRTIATICRAH